MQEGWRVECEQGQMSEGTVLTRALRAAQRRDTWLVVERALLDQAVARPGWPVVVMVELADADDMDYYVENAEFEIRDRFPIGEPLPVVTALADGRVLTVVMTRF